MIITIRYKGGLATVTLPNGQYVYDGAAYRDPFTAKRIALLDSEASPIGDNQVDNGTLSFGGSNALFAGNTARSVQWCEIVSVVASADTGEQVVHATPVVGPWVMITPAGTIRTVIQTPTVD